MNHIFLDTNVIIDFLADRQPYSEISGELFSLADKGKIKIHVSAITFNNAYYIIRRSVDHKKAIQILSELKSLVEIIQVDDQILSEALNSGYNDFEDAIQYHSALRNEKIEFIVTRNHKDFKKSDLPVLSPEMALDMVSK